MFFSLGIGDAFTIRDISIYPGRFDGKPHLIQTWQYAKARCLDTPIHHRLNGSKRFNEARILDNILDQGVCEFLLRENRKESFEFIETGKGAFANIDRPVFFRPSDWPIGLKLRIPVDFIRVYNLAARCENGPVRASVRIGHFLVFWNIEIYNPQDGVFFPTDSIHYSKLVDVINNLLTANEKIADLARYLSNAGQTDYNQTEFVDSVPGCDVSGKPPTLRFY